MAETWIILNEAAELIEKQLDVLPGVAREILQFEAWPPAVPWRGDVPCIIVDDGLPSDPEADWSPPEPGHTLRATGPVWQTKDLNRAWFTDAVFNWRECSMFSPMVGGLIGRLYIERNHLVALLNNRRPAPVVQPVPSAPVIDMVRSSQEPPQDQPSSAKPARKTPGPKPPEDRDAAIRVRLERGERPGTSGFPWKTWTCDIRKDCGIAALGPRPGEPLGFGDDAIRKATPAIQAEIEARRLEN